MSQKAPTALIAAFLTSWALPSAADSTQARCEIYPRGSDKVETMRPCTFSQRQGYITIRRNDGVTYDLSPVGDRILRMENAQASIVIQSPRGAEFTLNFMTDDVNAIVGEVKAKLHGDTWTLTRDNGEVYEVPLSAIEGG